jgi:hypothetical protein
MSRPLPPRGRASKSGAPVVFLSYAHAEAAIALPFCEALATCGLKVTVDVEHLQPGEDITEFALDSVRDADATICLVSPASLKSAWVVFEAMSTLQKENADPGARLITCATDQAVFEPTFGLDITRAIDERLANLNGIISQYLSQQADFTDLSTERSRWIRMRAGFGEVLDRVRNCLTIVITAETLRQSAERIADHIRNRRGQAPWHHDPRDIRARADELRQDLLVARTDEALDRLLDRLLDFVREFSDRAEHVRQATIVSHSLRWLAQGLKDKQLKFVEAEELRLPHIKELLVLIDEIEIRPQLPVAS